MSCAEMQSILRYQPQTNVAIMILAITLILLLRQKVSHDPLSNANCRFALTLVIVAMVEYLLSGNLQLKYKKYMDCGGLTGG